VSSGVDQQRTPVRPPAPPRPASVPASRAGTGGRDGEAGIGIDVHALREVSIKELAIRFAFGAAVSLVAAAVGQLAGSFAGGMMLAFPAILPATVTLLERSDGREEAVRDVQGAVLGALGLSLFALVLVATLPHEHGWLALPLAVVAWAGSSVLAYAAVEALGHRLRTRRARSGRRPVSG
jgi:hypothetical protein